MAVIYAVYFALLLAVFYATGALALRLGRWPAECAGGHTILAFACGMIFWMYFIFGLSAAGFLYLAPVVAAMFIVLAAFAWLHRRDFRDVARKVDLRRLRDVPWPRLALGAALIVALLPGFLYSLAPQAEWDAQVYHLLVPKLTIAHHGFRPIAFNVYSHWPMNVEQLFTLAMLVKDYRLAAPIHFWFGALCLTLIWLILREAGQPRTAALAPLFFLMNPTMFGEFGVALVDLAGAFFMLAAFRQVMRALQDPASRRRHLLLGGLFAGALAGSKFNGFFGAICLAALYLGVRRRAGGLARNAGETLLYFALPAFALWAPWAIKSALETGNPVYPELFGWFGGAEWNAALGKKLHGWLWSATGMGRKWGDYALLPIRVFLKGGGSYAHFAGRLGRAWLVLIPLSLTDWRRPLVRWSLAAAGLYFICWAAGSQQARLLAPALPLLSVAAGATLGDWLDRRRDGGRRSETALLVVAASLTALVGLGALGLIGRQFRGDEGWERPEPTPLMFEYINHNLPANARILFLNMNRGFFCERDYLADSFFEASQIDELLLRGDDATVDERLRNAGLTHVLVWGDPRRYSRRFVQRLGDPQRYQLLTNIEENSLYKRLD